LDISIVFPMINRITLLLFIGLAWGQDITLAVLEFEGDGVSQSETRTLTNRLRDEVFKTGVYIVLERGEMDEVLKEQGFQQTGCVTSECAVEVGNMLGVQQMIGGSIGKVGNMYTVSARIIDVETGKVLKSANYDHIGAIEGLLIDGMKNLAYDLTGKDGFVKKDITPKDEPITISYNQNTTMKDDKIKTRPRKITKNTRQKIKEEVDATDNGYAIELALASPRFVNPALIVWYSNVDMHIGIEFPKSIKFGITKLRFGVEIGTFFFQDTTGENIVYDYYKGEYIQVTSYNTYSGITAMGLMSFFPDSPGKIKIGAGIVGSSAGFMVEASYGFRVGKKLRIWSGIRNTQALNAESAIFEKKDWQFNTSGGTTLGSAGWIDACIGITYNWMQ
jgi:TolB-like protein